MSLIPSFFGRRSNVFDPFSLDIWDPFQDFPSGLTSSNLRSETSALANARIDWKESPEAHVFKADLPGLKKEEVKVELEEGRVLQISGERSREQEEKNDKWHRVERSSGKFLRRFRLPENAKVDEVKAAMENGVLTVTVPKEQVKKPDMSLIPSFFGRRSNVFDPFSLDIWDPFQDFPSGLTSSNLRSETSALANARIDWKETPEAHVFKADLPGLKKEEVKVELEEGRVLQISGERSREQEEKNDKWHRVERSSGKFLRRFRLPENARVDEVKAAMENGVLTVTVPKEQVKKADMSLIPSFFGQRGLTSPNLRSETSALANARIDWKETPEAHVFKADLPGLKKEEVKVELEEGRVLQISGERSREQEEKNASGTALRGAAASSLGDSENAKVDEVKAAMENGVLTVTVPKEQVKKPDVKAIDISP
ncbi:LOW QUALITY PROTEIN: Alpha crystallin/Hsp20 domain-containing protein [Cinnamomum micranthum f. kanehirae]|uniref:Alpha crystallin/Hsp20 domain-containing protein n=1 Tax=Cinnamomum micranthum f. kanehirae TaxID=337451 RepID=A0A3S3R9G8_9MAGN|nr:LOW QUALITY PROTEIN: Alpha crystallin/Hsp20 domain-containing protein [Cinnamomum micranthum f. kanehirae]